MSATTNQTLLRAALRKAGVTLAPGRPPAPEQITEAINEENRMIGSWNVDPLKIFTENRSIYTTIPNQQTNTIGIDPTGTSVADFNGPRPFAINAANLLLYPSTDPPPNPLASGGWNASQWDATQWNADTSQSSSGDDPTQQIQNVRRPIKIWIRQDWQRHRFQGVYTYPEGLYYDANYDANGFGTIYWYPIPNQAYWVELFTWQPLQKFGSPADLVILPDGYEDAIVNNLAVRLNQFPWTVKGPMDPSVIVEAQRSLAVIQQMNIRVPRLYTDRELRPDIGGVYWPAPGVGYDE